MNPPRRQNADKPDLSKELQKVKCGKAHAILDRIREARQNCGDRVKMLPVVLYERKLWFFDRPLRQLRNVRNPHDFIDLNEFEMEFFREKVI